MKSRIIDRVLDFQIINQLEERAKSSFVSNSFRFAYSLVEDIADSPNFDGDFRRLVVSAVSLLFDSPFVCIWQIDREELAPIHSILPKEYDFIMRGSKLRERFFHEGWPQREIIWLGRGNFSFLEEERNRYDSKLHRQKEGTNVKKRRLVEIVNGCLIPVFTKNGKAYCLGIFLDHIPEEVLESEAIFREVLANRRFLRAAISDRDIENVILGYFKELFDLDRDSRKTELTDTKYSLIERKENFIRSNGDRYSRQESMGKVISEFGRDFGEWFRFVDGAISSFHDSLGKAEGKGLNPVLMYGEPTGDGYSYLFTFNQIQSIFERKGEERVEFADFRTLWTHEFNLQEGVFAYIATTGVPEHTIDVSRDIRLLRYDSKVRELENKIIGSGEIRSAFAFPILLDSKGTLLLAGYFMSEHKQIPVSDLLYYCKRIYSSRKAVELAIRQQELHKKEIEDERAENWRSFSVGLTHDLVNDIQCYRPYLSSFLSFLEALQKHQADLPSDVWNDFVDIMRKKLLHSVAAITEEISKRVDGFIEKRYSSISKLGENINWIYGTNEERAELIQFLEDFAMTTDKANLQLEIKDIELPFFLDSVHKRIKRWIEARSMQDEREDVTKWLRQDFLPWPENRITSIKGSPALLKFIFYELLKNAKRYAAWQINGRELPIFWQVLSSDKGLIRFRIINDYDVYSDGPRKCEDCGSITLCYRPVHRHRMGGKWEGWRCHDHLRDEVRDTLSRCWESGVSAAGSGSGLFMISFMLEKLYQCHTDSGILRWDEGKNERVIYFEIELPDFE